MENQVVIWSQIKQSRPMFVDQDCLQTLETVYLQDMNEYLPVERVWNESILYLYLHVICRIQQTSSSRHFHHQSCPVIVLL